MAFDFNSLLPSKEETAEIDLARGFACAAPLVLKIEEELKRRFPNESPAFYQGCTLAIREEM